jgi:hypothetical protein
MASTSVETVRPVAAVSSIQTITSGHPQPVHMTFSDVRDGRTSHTAVTGEQTLVMRLPEHKAAIITLPQMEEYSVSETAMGHLTAEGEYNKHFVE